MRREKAIETLRKLLSAQAGELALGNEAAAHSFGAKVAELLIKHKLEISDIPDDERHNADPLATCQVQAHEWGDQFKTERTDYIELLGNVIAEAYFCRLLCLIDSNTLILVGRVSDMWIARQVLCVITRTALSLCETELAEALFSQSARGFGYRLGPEFNEDFRASFFQGFSERVRDRLRAERIKAELEAGACTALARVDKDVEEYVKSEVKPIEDESERKRRELIGGAYAAGAVHGERVNIKPTLTMIEKE